MTGVWASRASRYLVELAEFSTGNTSNTWTDMASTVVRQAAGNPRRIDFTPYPFVYLNFVVATVGASTARIAPVFSTALVPNYTWVMADGSTSALSDGAAAPAEPNAFQAVSGLDSLGSKRATITIPPSLRRECAVIISRWGGDGAADPVIQYIRILAPLPYGMLKR